MNYCYPGLWKRSIDPACSGDPLGNRGRLTGQIKFRSIKKPEDVIDFGFKVSTYKGGITCPTAYMIKLLQIKSRIKCMKSRRRDPSIHQNFIPVCGA
jgi:hypothetical protein